MQIKTTMRYHFTQVKMAIIQKLKITSVGMDMEKKECLHTIDGNIN
jgi:hypothetical protein